MSSHSGKSAYLPIFSVTRRFSMQDYKIYCKVTSHGGSCVLPRILIGGGRVRLTATIGESA